MCSFDEDAIRTFTVGDMGDFDRLFSSESDDETLPGSPLRSAGSSRPSSTLSMRTDMSDNSVNVARTPSYIRELNVTARSEPAWWLDDSRAPSTSSAAGNGPAPNRAWSRSTVRALSPDRSLKFGNVAVDSATNSIDVSSTDSDENSVFYRARHPTKGGRLPPLPDFSMPSSMSSTSTARLSRAPSRNSFAVSRLPNKGKVRRPVARPTSRKQGKRSAAATINEPIGPPVSDPNKPTVYDNVLDSINVTAASTSKVSEPSSVTSSALSALFHNYQSDSDEDVAEKTIVPQLTQVRSPSPALPKQEEKPDIEIVHVKGKVLDTVTPSSDDEDDKTAIFDTPPPTQRICRRISSGDSSKD